MKSQKLKAKSPKQRLSLRRFFIPILSTFYFLLSAIPAHAFQVGVKVNNQDTFASFEDYVDQVYYFAKNTGIALAVLMIIYAGYKYVTSGGNQTAIGQAKEIITSVLLGLALLILVTVIADLLIR